LGVCAGDVEGQAAGGFQFGVRARGAADGFSALLDCHVVQQHQGYLGGQCLVQLFEGAYLHLTGQCGSMRPHGRDRRGHRTSRGHMVVFDQHCIPEPHSVVDPAAAAHRVLLQCAQTRQRLA
jgi:hypothetical protein